MALFACVYSYNVFQLGNRYCPLQRNLSRRHTAMTEETREVLTNPFQEGEEVSIPAGTTYTSTNPALKGRLKTKRTQTVTVAETFPAFLVRTKTDRVLIRPLRIRTTGSGGYAKDINITEQIVRLNGKIPHYEQVQVDV
jgi:hypothetical protein